MPTPLEFKTEDTASAMVYPDENGKTLTGQVPANLAGVWYVKSLTA